MHLFKDDFEKIYNIEPKVYTDKTSGQQEIGYIAEEFVAAGLEELVIFDAEGRPNGLKYDRMSLYLLEIMKKRDSQIDQLSKEVTELKSLISRVMDQSN